MHELLRPGERLDDLQCGGLLLIQSPDAFRFGTDSVLLADFAAPRPGDVCADLGCGTGAIATLMLAHQPGIQRMDAVEIQPAAADMAARSAAINGLEEKLRIHQMDMRTAAQRLGSGRHTLVVCNPPYGRKGATLTNQNQSLSLARHEGDLTIEEACRAASALLKNGGRFCVIFPAPRALEMMCAMRQSKLEPKRIRTVHSLAGRAPKFVLMDAVKGAGSTLHWLEPLVMREADGQPTQELRRIYRQ